MLSRTALPVLLTSSLLRAIISLDPSLDIHLDCVFFNTQLLHITSVAVWISLSITCFALLWRIVTSTTRRGRFAAVLSRAAQSSLLLFSLLRVVKIFFPRPISSLDAGLDNNTQLLYGVSVSMWISLTITCFVLFLLWQIVHYRAAKFALGAGTILAVPYVVWVIDAIYQQWVSSFSVAFQFVYAVPSIAFLAHSTYQAYFVFKCWKCLRLKKRAPVQLSWPAAWTNILYNTVMIAHMLSVAVVTIKDKRISDLPLWFMAIELHYRLLAICVFCRMYYTAWYTKARRESGEELHNRSAFVVGPARVAEEFDDNRNIGFIIENYYMTIGLQPTHDKHEELVIQSRLLLWSSSGYDPPPNIAVYDDPSESLGTMLDDLYTISREQHVQQPSKEEFCC